MTQPTAIIASSIHDIPLHPPAEWFTPPANQPTDRRLTVTETGRVYGYIALWNSCHVGLDGCVPPPKGSPSDYAYAHVGETLCADETVIKTAVIAGGIPHPATNLPNNDIPNIYANTGTQLMRVCYGEDEHGLWFAGALFPGLTDHDIATIRASALSGDWRWHAQYRKEPNGGYDFSGAIMVNIPGYRIEADSLGAGRSEVLVASAHQDPERVIQTGQHIVAGSTTHFQRGGGATAKVMGILLIEGLKTEDGRIITENATEFRDPPLPLYAALENTFGHEGADLVGRIDTLERDGNRILYTATVFLDSANGAGGEVITAIENGMLTGISVDGIAGPDDTEFTDDETIVFNKFVIAGATLTPLPAMRDTTVTITSDATDAANITITSDGGGGCGCGGEKTITAQGDETTDDAPAPDGVATDEPARVAVEEAVDTEGAITLEKIGEKLDEVLARIDTLEDELVLSPRIEELADDLRDDSGE